MISRRSLFAFLAGAPFGAVAAVKAAADAAPIAARSVDPPLIAFGDPIMGPVNIGAAQITWIDDAWEYECQRRRKS